MICHKFRFWFCIFFSDYLYFLTEINEVIGYINWLLEALLIKRCTNIQYKKETIINVFFYFVMYRCHNSVRFILNIPSLYSSIETCGTSDEH